MKTLLAILAWLLFTWPATAQQRLFDQKTIIKQCNLSITANPFIATTIVEMEFYNDKNEEVEALQRFRLLPGQVITNLQLMLDGKYRDGSVEERRKAANSYNSIVGKRVDPAIIQMESDNHYSLRIYPVPAKSSRKITFTVVQKMIAGDMGVSYHFLTNFGLAEAAEINISVTNAELIPKTGKGLISSNFFSRDKESSNLQWNRKMTVLSDSVSFTIPIRKPVICLSENSKSFITVFNSGIPSHSLMLPDQLLVFWDASSSAVNRDLNKELDFLEMYIREKKIARVSIQLFNHRLLHRISYNSTSSFGAVRKYLQSYRYHGATCLGLIDLSAATEDAALIFSDGHNTYGSDMPIPGVIRTNCITSEAGANYAHLERITRLTGGQVFTVGKNFILSDKLDQTRSLITDISKKDEHFRISEKLPIAVSPVMFLSGDRSNSAPLSVSIQLNSHKKLIQKIDHEVNSGTDFHTYRLWKMLEDYEQIKNQYYSDEQICFGMENRVVTFATSFLVLERIEDYINYKIAPPPELVAECMRRGYVYQSPYLKKKEKVKLAPTNSGAVTDLLRLYNNRIRKYDRSAILLNVNYKPSYEGRSAIEFTGNTTTDGNTLKEMKPSALEEVVITSGYSVRRSARSSSSSVQIIQSDIRSIQDGYISTALAGTVPGLRVTGRDNMSPGAGFVVNLRGSSSINSSSSPVYVVNGHVMQSLEAPNVNDIENVTVLTGVASTALYGAEGANGAIVIQLRSARKQYYNRSWKTYRLEDCEEEDYITRISSVADKDLLNTYETLEITYRKEPSFYFDMADHFLSKNKKEYAIEMLMNGMDMSKDKYAATHASAYLMEKHHLFDEAITIYQQLMKENKSMWLVRDLALCYVQAGRIKEAVQTYNSMIMVPDQYWRDDHIREAALTEMNGLISAYGDEYDLSFIDSSLLYPLPHDLYISVTSNRNYIYGFQVMTGKTDVNKIYQSAYTFSVRDAAKGKFKIVLQHYDMYSFLNYRRIIAFKNFGRKGMKLETQLVNLDNQYGNVEIGSVRWER